MGVETAEESETHLDTTTAGVRRLLGVADPNFQGEDVCGPGRKHLRADTGKYMEAMHAIGVRRGFKKVPAETRGHLLATPTQVCKWTRRGKARSQADEHRRAHSWRARGR